MYISTSTNTDQHPLKNYYSNVYLGAVFVIIFLLQPNFMKAQDCTINPGDVVVNFSLPNGSEHQSIFKGRETNPNGTSSWTFCFKTLVNNGLSHFAIGQLATYLDCMDGSTTIIDTGTAVGCIGGDEEGVIVCDPTTNVCGIKWDCALEEGGSNECACVTFILDDDYAGDGDIDIGVKAGNANDVQATVGPNCLNILPVELVYFKTTIHHEGEVELSWQTATEDNNLGFEIQRSPDLQTWKALHFINGHGTTNNFQNYSFVDTRPLPGDNYYRLKQIDFNGKFDFSEVRHQYVAPGKSANMLIYPNPTAGQFHVQFFNPEKKLVHAKLFDSTGMVIWEKRWDGRNMPKSWKETFNLDQKEIYMMMTQIDDKVETKRISVVKL